MEEERLRRLNQQPVSLLFDFKEMPFEISLQILLFLDSKSLMITESVRKERRSFKDDERLWPVSRLSQRMRPSHSIPWQERVNEEGGIVEEKEAIDVLEKVGAVTQGKINSRIIINKLLIKVLSSHTCLASILAVSCYFSPICRGVYKGF